MELEILILTIADQTGTKLTAKDLALLKQQTMELQDAANRQAQTGVDGAKNVAQATRGVTQEMRSAQVAVHAVGMAMDGGLSPAAAIGLTRHLLAAKIAAEGLSGAAAAGAMGVGLAAAFAVSAAANEYSKMRSALKEESDAIKKDLEDFAKTQVSQSVRRELGVLPSTMEARQEQASARAVLAVKQQQYADAQKSFRESSQNSKEQEDAYGRMLRTQAEILELEKTLRSDPATKEESDRVRQGAALLTSRLESQRKLNSEETKAALVAAETAAVKDVELDAVQKLQKAESLRQEQARIVQQNAERDIDVLQSMHDALIDQKRKLSDQDKAGNEEMDKQLRAIRDQIQARSDLIEQARQQSMLESQKAQVAIAQAGRAELAAGDNAEAAQTAASRAEDGVFDPRLGRFTRVGLPTQGRFGQQGSLPTQGMLPGAGDIVGTMMSPAEARGSSDIVVEKMVNFGNGTNKLVRDLLSKVQQLEAEQDRLTAQVENMQP